MPAETPLTVAQLPAPRTVSANVDSDFEHTHGYVARLSQNRSKPVQYLGCADFGTIEGLHTCFQKAAFRVRAPGKAGSVAVLQNASQLSRRLVFGIKQSLFFL